MKHPDYLQYYGVKNEKLSYEFIAGLITGEGTFYWTKNIENHKEVPAFSLHMHVRDFDLLVNVRSSLELEERIYEYGHRGRHYALLLVRNFDSLRKLILNIYPRLAGFKKMQFIQWFKGFRDENIEERYRTIYNIFKSRFPELYQ